MEEQGSLHPRYLETLSSGLSLRAWAARLSGLSPLLGQLLLANGSPPHQSDRSDGDHITDLNHQKLG